MKKISSVLLISLMLFSFSGCNACEENVLDKVGDWAATIGKDGLAKDKVLVERKANRAAKCTEQSAGDMKKKMGF